jgi:hypothetical protein
MTVSWRHFALHYVEMVVAMFVGMMALDPAWAAGFAAFDAEATFDRPDVYALIMGLNMVIGMWLWMWIRGHSNRMNVEMAAAMYAPFIVGVFPYWFGWINGDVLIWGGHILMFLTMLGAMIPRRVEYSHHHGFRWSKPKPAAAPATAE